MEPLIDRVKRGAAALDIARPGWAHSVDVDILDMNQCTRCVVGQLAGTMDNYRDLFPEWRETVYRSDNPMLESHGFWMDNSTNADDEDADVDYEQLHKDYQTLTELWRIEILERLMVKEY